MLLWMMSGLQLPVAEAASLMVFFPKGITANEGTEVVRAAEDTRPLSLKNHGSRLSVRAFLSLLTS